MSFRIDIPRIRVALDISKKTGDLTDVISGGSVNFPRGSDLRFEFGLFYGDGIADPSLLTVARFRLRNTSDPDGGSLAVDKTIGIAQMNPGISLEDWQGGEADKCHLAFEFTAAELAESVFGAEPSDSGVQHWLLLTYGATDRHLFGGLITSFDAGHNASGNAPPSDPTNISKSEVEALLASFGQQFVRYKGNPPAATIELTAPSSGKKALVGVDDDGNFLTPTQTTT